MGSFLEDPPVLTAAADFPELCVEWLPTQGPRAADGEWCDITAYVAAGNSTRGRQYALDRFQAGTLSLTLKAATRLFDQDNSDGPFFPYLIPMRQVRVSAVWDSVRYPVWRGYVTDWGQTVLDDSVFVTEITAHDAFAWLERIALPSSAWALEVVKDNPDAWFRLGESDTPRVTDSSPGGNYGIYDNCEQGVPGLVVNDADGAVAFAHSLEERVKIQSPDLIAGYPFTVSALVQIARTSGVDDGMILTALAGSSPSSVNDNGLHFYVSGFGRLTLGVGNLTTGRYQRASVLVDDGLPHHVLCVASSSSSFTMYVDGVAGNGETLTYGSGTPTWVGSFPTGYIIGNVTDIGGGDYGFGTNDPGQSAASIAEGGWYVIDQRGVIDEVCVWDGVEVSAERAAAHAFAALTGWEGDTTGERVERFLDAIDWPATLRDIDPGISILGPAKWSRGDSALNVLQGWADTELGGFFIGKNGEVTWRSRHYPYLDSDATSSQATFGDAHSGETLTYHDCVFVRDEALLRNPVTASRDGGVSVTVQDTAYIQGKYGDRSYGSPTTQDRDDASVRDRALWILARYKDLTSRLERLVVLPQSAPDDLYPVVLGLEFGERITVKRTPLGQGTEIESGQIVERIAHEFGPKVWRSSFVGSPVDPNVGDYLILDDEGFGLLDTGLLAY